jgi:hypothetical protein
MMMTNFTDSQIDSITQAASTHPCSGASNGTDHDSAELTHPDSIFYRLID